jgi:hypothetical protein
VVLVVLEVVFQVVEDLQVEVLEVNVVLETARGIRRVRRVMISLLQRKNQVAKIESEERAILAIRWGILVDEVYWMV